jgi:hypothetical protein
LNAPFFWRVLDASLGGDNFLSISGNRRIVWQLGRQLRSALFV